MLKKILTLCTACFFVCCAQVQADEASVDLRPSDKQKQQTAVEIEQAKEKCPCPKGTLATVEMKKAKELAPEVQSEELIKAVPAKEESLLAVCPGGKCPNRAPVVQSAPAPEAQKPAPQSAEEMNVEESAEEQVA